MLVTGIITTYLSLRLLVGRGFPNIYPNDQARGGDKKLEYCGFCNQDLLLAQKIEVGLAGGTRIDDRGEVARKIIRIAAGEQRKSKGSLSAT